MHITHVTVASRKRLSASVFQTNILIYSEI